MKTQCRFWSLYCHQITNSFSPWATVPAPHSHSMLAQSVNTRHWGLALISLASSLQATGLLLLTPLILFKIMLHLLEKCRFQIGHTILLVQFYFSDDTIIDSGPLLPGQAGPVLPAAPGAGLRAAAAWAPASDVQWGLTHRAPGHGPTSKERSPKWVQWIRGIKGIKAMFVNYFNIYIQLHTIDDII